VDEEEARGKYRELVSKRRLVVQCWDWLGPKQKGKIPMTSFRKRCISVRKCMYLIMNRVDECSSPVYNTCGNPLCFNPDHLTVERPKNRRFHA